MNPTRYHGRSKVVAHAIVVASVAMLAPAASAQPVHAAAAISDQQAVVGEPIELTITIDGAQNIPPPEVRVEGFTVAYVGPATSVSIVNGQMAVSVTHHYTLLPTKAGHWTIPPISLQVDGKTLQTDPVSVDVAASSSVAGASPTSAAESGSASGQLAQALQLQIALDRTKVYVNEPVPARIQLLVGGASLRQIEMPKLEADGFLVKPIGQPTQSPVIVNGISYTLLEFATTVIPTRPGRLTLGPASMTCQIAARSRRRPGRGSASDSDPIEQFFGDNSLFDEMFGETRLMSVPVRADAVQLEVLPLPTEGRPADFRGAIGRFTMQRTVVPDRVKAGEPVTVTTTVQGEGNFDSLSAPTLAGDVSHFKVYDPKSRHEDAPTGHSGKTTFEQVLIPLDTSVTAVPEARLSFFDPLAGKYRTETAPPAPITVEPAANPEPSPIIGQPFSAPSHPSTPIGRDLAYIKERPGRVLRVGRAWHERSTWVWLSLLPIGLLVGNEAWRRRRQQVVGDPRAARASGALKRALAQCQEAQRAREAGKAREAYAEVFRAIQRYIGDRFGYHAEGMTAAELHQALEPLGVPDELVQELAELCRRCDVARFASESTAAEQIDDTLQRTQAVLKRLDRWKGK